MRVLLTSGPCEEPIDNVRCISNFSSGRTGAELAQAFYSQGAQVRLIHGLRAQKPENPGIGCISFQSYQDLAEILQEELRTFRPGILVHLAAVSDYSVHSLTIGEKSYAPKDISKIDSQEVDRFTLEMQRNPKLINSLRSWAGDDCLLVGFKLTSRAGLEEREQRASKLLDQADLDYVVSNDLSEITSKDHPYRIYRAGGEMHSLGECKEEMQQDLIQIWRSL